MYINVDRAVNAQEISFRNVHKLKEEVSKRFEQSGFIEKKIILDISGINALDYTGLQSFLAIKEMVSMSFAKTKTEVILNNPTKIIFDFMQKLGFDKKIQITYADPEIEIIGKLIISLKETIGPRIGGPTSSKMHLKIKEVIEANPSFREFILDFKDMEYIDGSGLGCLVIINNYLNKNKKIMSLKNLPDNFKALFKIANLHRIFRIASDE